MRTNRKAADLSAPPRVCPKGSVTGNESATSAPVSVLPCSSFLVLMTPSSHPQIPRACWAASSLPGGRGKCVSLPSQLALVVLHSGTGNNTSLCLLEEVQWKKRTHAKCVLFCVPLAFCSIPSPCKHWGGPNILEMRVWEYSSDAEHLPCRGQGPGFSSPKLNGDRRGRNILGLDMGTQPSVMVFLPTHLFFVSQENLG